MISPELQYKIAELKYNFRIKTKVFRDFKRSVEKELLANLTVILFHFIRAFYWCKCINYPKVKCIFALWHAHQCGVFRVMKTEKPALWYPVQKMAK